MNPLRSVSRRGFFLAAAVLAVAGCLSPTLPLPPPSRPDVSSPDAAGFVRITGSVQSDSVVFAENKRTGRITGQTTDETGDYDLELAARVGDRLSIWYTVGTIESPPVDVTVPDAAGPGPGGFGGTN